MVSLIFKRPNPQKKTIVMKLIKTILWIYLIIFKRYKFLRGISFHVLNWVSLQCKRPSSPHQMYGVSARDNLCTHNVEAEIACWSGFYKSKFQNKIQRLIDQNHRSRLKRQVHLYIFIISDYLMSTFLSLHLFPSSKVWLDYGGKKRFAHANRSF